MVGELCNGDLLFGRCLVPDLDLSLKIIVTRPLIQQHAQSTVKVDSTEQYETDGCVPRCEYAW